MVQPHRITYPWRQVPEPTRHLVATVVQFSTGAQKVAAVQYPPASVRAELVAGRPIAMTVHPVRHCVNKQSGSPAISLFTTTAA